MLYGICQKRTYNDGTDSGQRKKYKTQKRLLHSVAGVFATFAGEESASPLIKKHLLVMYIAMENCH